MDAPVPALADRAATCATALRESHEVLLASHIDADGLTSAAVAAIALERATIPYEVVFSKQLDANEIARFAESDHDTVLFTDFGSGQLDIITTHADRGDFLPVICDHHEPAAADIAYHLNPLLEGIDGSIELSGAGTTYALARALEDGGDNRDLAALAIVGAVGDMQASDGALTGANEGIVDDGIASKVIETRTDLALYGVQTRPLPKLLEYASDVRIPGISNDERGALRFLDDLDIPLHEGDEWRRWVDLSEAEQRLIVNGLIRTAVASGVPATRIDSLVGTRYILTNEDVGTELRDASEFSTLLNATARYERADVGLGVCLGDRGSALIAARKLLRNHRRNLSAGLSWVRSTGVFQEDHLQWFDAGNRIPDTIVGIIAGMSLGTSGVDHNRPILAFAEKNDTELKVSARGTQGLVRRGLDLSIVMREASQAVGGDGGGHTVAAGATIPACSRSEFIARADALVGKQVKNI